jgi:hypothetical protein
LVAESERDFATLLDGAADSLGQKPVIVDALRREESALLLKERGLQVQRRLTRMTLGEPKSILCDRRLRLAVAFEWG